MMSRDVATPVNLRWDTPRIASGEEMTEDFPTAAYTPHEYPLEPDTALKKGCAAKRSSHSNVTGTVSKRPDSPGR